MPQMTYFRRSALAGKSLKRTTAATLRGNKRRNDIDGLSAVPYFPNVTTGDTLIIEGVAGGVPTTATVGIPSDPSNRAAVTEVVAAITAACTTINVQAFDDGGCVGLRSTLAGSAGRVWVKGGTAAVALGFVGSENTTRFLAIGGDIVSTPEGRGIGQPYGAALPVPGENLTSDVFVRGLGRTMANMDVLYSELVKNEIIVKKIGTVTAGLAALTNVDLGTQKVFVGLTAPTKEQLAHLFFFVDQATKQISQCKVVDAVDQMSPTTDVFGRDQLVLGPATITGITEGSVVESTGGNFIGSGVQAGDLATISGAENLQPFSNNGYRWVVEKVLDNTRVVLRPMSQAELDLVNGTSSPEGQPTVELNDSATGAWGSITITRGPFSTSVRLVVDPPIPKGATFDIVAPVPASARERQLQDLADRGYGVFSALTHDFDSAPNAIISRPSLTSASPSVAVGPFMVLFHGRPVRVPGQSFTPGAGVATWYLYWDENDCQLKASTNPAVFSVTEQRAGLTTDELAGRTPRSANKGQHIATAVVDSFGNVTSLKPAVRVQGDMPFLTVGHGGQFQALEEALEFVRRAVASGATRGHTEILLLSNQTCPPAGWVLPGAPISIRGAAPAVYLVPPTGTNYFTGGVADFLILSNLTVHGSKTVYGSDPLGMWTVSNVYSFGTPNITFDHDGIIVIGTKATRIDLKSAIITYSSFTAQQGLSVPTGTYGVQVGGEANVGEPSGHVARARMEVSGGQGRLVLSKTANGDITLNWDQLQGLTGGGPTTLHSHTMAYPYPRLVAGPTENVDDLHTHHAHNIGAHAFAGLTAATIELQLQEYYISKEMPLVGKSKWIDDNFTVTPITNAGNANVQRVSSYMSGRPAAVLQSIDATAAGGDNSRYITTGGYSYTPRLSGVGATYTAIVTEIDTTLKTLKWYEANADGNLDALVPGFTKPNSFELEYVLKCNAVYYGIFSAVGSGVNQRQLMIVRNAAALTAQSWTNIWSLFNDSFAVFRGSAQGGGGDDCKRLLFIGYGPSAPYLLYNPTGEASVGNWQQVQVFPNNLCTVYGANQFANDKKLIVATGSGNAPKLTLVTPNANPALPGTAADITANWTALTGGQPRFVQDGYKSSLGGTADNFLLYSFYSGSTGAAFDIILVQNDGSMSKLGSITPSGLASGYIENMVWNETYDLFLIDSLWPTWSLYAGTLGSGCTPLLTRSPTVGYAYPGVWFHNYTQDRMYGMPPTLDTNQSTNPFRSNNG
jgi:hypothetical protein